MILNMNYEDNINQGTKMCFKSLIIYWNKMFVPFKNEKTKSAKAKQRMEMNTRNTDETPQC